jgi:hypothetical protein
MLAQITEIPLPQSNSQPFSTACEPDGVYFTEQAGRIARVNYTTLAITQWTPQSKEQTTSLAIGTTVNVIFDN